MSTRPRSLAFLVCLALLPLTLGGAGPSAEQSARPAPAGGNRYALLVGCTAYPQLGKAWQLEGPANDVVLMERMLREQFGVPPDHIVILSEAEGRKDPRKLPTRENIAREFLALPGKLHAGDRVVILLGGHGSQQPEYPERKPGLPPEQLEDDGLDEIFLPRDTGTWDPVRKVVPNAIVDDELHEWTGRILATGASLWFIADSCHSGTLLRGASEEKPREITPRDGLKIPEGEMQAARERARQRGRLAPTPAAESPCKLEGAGDHLVALYAAQSTEVTVEMPVPIDDKGHLEVHGLLTYTLCKALAQSAAPPTYRELVQRIRARYDGMNRTFPTPLVEGKDLDREVLGEKEFPGRGRFFLKGNADDGWKVSGGTLHGLTEKSILAVYDESNRKVGHVEVAESRLLDADVATPQDEARWPKAPRLHAGWRCEPEYIHYGPQRLKVAAEFVADARHPPATAEQQRREAEQFRSQAQQLRHALESFIQSDGASLLETTADPARADCLVRADARTGKVYLVPAEGVGTPARDTHAEESAPLVGSPSIGQLAELKLPLQRLARARGLLALAPENERVRGESAVRIGVELIRLRDKRDRKGEVVPFQPGGLVLKDGELIRLRLTNPNDFAVYPTLLFIDSGYGIQALYPTAGQVAEAVEAHGHVVTVPLRVTSKTLGRERVVALAVKAGRTPVDFSFLEQPTIERARGAATRGDTDPLTTPLGQLLRSAVYHEGGTRGMARVDLDEYGTALLSWQTRPAR